MNKSVTFILLIFLFICLFSGCDKCVQHQITDLSFTEDDLSINPYSGNEILIFKTEKGDSLVLSKGKRNSEKFTMYQIDYEDAKNYHNGCRGDYITAEANWFQYSTNPEDVNFRISISLSFSYTFDHPSSNKNIWLVFDLGKNTTGFWGNFSFNNDSLYAYDKKLDSIVAFHNQILIGTKNFNNVYELYCHNEDPRNTEWFSSAFYSVKEGFCGVRSNFGKLWYLEKNIKF